jgi:membrane protein implicated in regulation of membrane protease activity
VRPPYPLTRFGRLKSLLASFAMVIVALAVLIAALILGYVIAAVLSVVVIVVIAVLFVRSLFRRRSAEPGPLTRG